MLAADVLNNQSRIAGKGWPFSLGVVRGAKNSDRKNLTCREIEERITDMDRIFGAGQGHVAGSYEHGSEAACSTQCVVLLD
jgi:hypothetical protein